MRLRQTETKKAALAARHNYGTGLSASGIAATEGDDLHRSRYFSLKAGIEMTAIIDADRTITDTMQERHTPLSQGRDPLWLCERLSIIQREAKRARARAIYRSAQDALGLIQRCNVHMPIDWVRVDGRLFVLNKLLGQYEVGLSEVEIEVGIVVPAPSPDTALHDRKVPGIDGQDTDILAADIKDEDLPGEDIPGEQAQSQAEQTLRTLLPHASADEHAALSRLMDVDLTPAPPTPEIKSVDQIEWIMPSLVQRLLEVGRQYGKVFSVSHSLDDVLIDAGSADSVQARLFDRLSDLIASNLPLQGVGRLDICASENELLISGSGFDAFAVPLNERVADRMDETTNTNTIAHDLDARPITPPRPPMITDDTEDLLRAQLAALMDGGLASFQDPDQ